MWFQFIKEINFLPENIGYEPTEAESALPWKRDEVDAEPELSRFSRVSGVDDMLVAPGPGYWTNRSGTDAVDLWRRFFDDVASTGSDPVSTGSDPSAAGNDPTATGSDPPATGSDPTDHSHDAAEANDDDETVGMDSDEFTTTIL